MRRGLLVAGALAVAAAALAFALGRFSVVVEAYARSIAAEASARIGTRVELSGLHVSFRGGPSVEAREVRIAQPPPYGGDLVRAASVRVFFSPLPFLFGDYRIRRVRIDAPAVRLLYTEKGFNLPHVTARSSAAIRPWSPVSAAAAAEPWPAFGEIEASDGTIELVLADDPALRTARLQRVDLSVREGRGAPARIELQGAVFDPARQDLVASALLGPDLDFTATASIDRLSLDGLRAQPWSPPFLHGLSSPDPLVLRLAAHGTGRDFHLDGTLDAGAARLSLGACGKPPGVPLQLSVRLHAAPTRTEVEMLRIAAAQAALSGQGALAPELALDLRSQALPLAGWERLCAALEPLAPSGSATIEVSVRALPLRARARLSSPAGELAGVPFEQLDATIAVTTEAVSIESLRARVLDGVAVLRARHALSSSAETGFELDARIENADLTRLLRPPARIEGRLAGEIVLQGPRILDAQQLRGRGRVDVRQGVLRDVNLAEDVLARDDGLRELVDLVPPRVRERYPALFATRDTPFEELHAGFAIADARARSEDVRILARDFTVNGQGTISFDQKVAGSGTLLASAPLSAEIMREAPAARHLANRDRRLEIPFELRGTLSHVRVRPQREFVARAAERAVGERVERLLGDERRQEKLRRRLERLLR